MMQLNNLIPATGGSPLNIRISGGIIAGIATPEAETKDQEAHGPVLQFEDAIVFPGLINSHDHLDFDVFPALGNRKYKDYVEWGEDIHLHNKNIIEAVLKIPKPLRLRWGQYKNLISGITTVVNHGPPETLDSDLIHVYQNCHVLHSVQLEKHWRLKLNNPFTGAWPFVIHVGEGSTAAVYREINRLLQWNLMKRKLVGVHGIAMDAQQAAGFEALVWCPASNYFLIGKTAPVQDLKHQTRILFGTDSTVSSGWNIWKHLRLALQEGSLSAAELFDSLTKTPAEIWGLTGKGCLEKGAEADLVIARKPAKTGLDGFFALEPEDILMVMVQGRVKLFDTAMADEMAKLPLDTSQYEPMHLNGQMKYIFGKPVELMREIRKYYPGAVFPVH